MNKHISKLIKLNSKAQDCNSRVKAQKILLKHDDRLDCLAQGVKYFTDALSISAYEAIKLRKQDEFNDMLQSFLDDPQASANHIVMGMNLDQRKKAKGKETGKPLPTWT